MSFKRYRIIFILIFVFSSRDGGGVTFTMVNANDRETTKQHMTNDMKNAQSENKESRALFPRLEYNGKWMPVGRGDPLKDPTFDYMPPVLDRVRYWADGTSQKINNNDILLLGVPSKKQLAQNRNDKYSYGPGPVKRTYYSAPYQSNFPSQYHQQQQPYHPQRLPPKMSTHHQQQHGWNNNVYHLDARPENSISYKTVVRPPVLSLSTTTRPPSTHFLPTISPMSNSMMHFSQLEDSNASSTHTLPMTSTEKTSAIFQSLSNNENGHMRDTTKPLLHSILQTETASPFNKKPSSVYQIEYTSNIYNPEAINSMVTSSSFTTAFTPTKPSIRPVSIKATTKTRTTVEFPLEMDEQKHYEQPEMHMGWPIFNLIIEGHSKVKTYGSKNDDPIGSRLPNIRPVQANKNPIVEHVTNNESTRPEFPMTKSKQTAMTSLMSLLDGSFGNFLGTGNKRQQVEGGNKRKVRSIETTDQDKKQERVLGIAFQVDDIQPQIYRKGTVISESLWPFGSIDMTR